MSQLVEERTEQGTRRWRDDWPVAVVAAAGAAAVWVVATQVASVDLAVRSGSGTQHVNVVSVIVTALVVAVAAAGLLRFLEARHPRGRTIWTAIAVAVWVVSVVGPLSAQRRSRTVAGCLARGGRFGRRGRPPSSYAARVA